ncbi:MAG TPA: phospholipase D family protein [Caldimonas sp.]|nr:phospholipase D family protein [Caldimonas sp.]
MTFAVEPSAATPLGRGLLPLAEQHPGKTGVFVLADGRLAFAMRMLMAREAAQSIDIQTYIWRGDATGTMMFEEVLRAAERGVRVRLLLDDANTSGLDPTLALLASNPNLELRLYNPFVGRSARGLGILADFERLNHRMHNKSFSVDNQVTVVGGRNIADEYFEAGQETRLVDLDVAAIGQAVREVSAQFDLYWNSASAYPAELLLGGVQAEPRAALAQRAEDLQRSPGGVAYAAAIASTHEVERLRAGTLELEWAVARVVHDDPAKTLAPSTETDLQMLPQLLAAFGQPTASLDLVSAYFVPGDAGTEALTALARRGIRVRVVTNSLAATDVVSVHAGYVKRREPLLRAGVELYELKPQPSAQQHAMEIGSSSKAGLHAKTYAVDQRAIFVGSFNLDPRSARLNTEMGLLIESSVLAKRLAGVVDAAYPAVAYRVTLAEDGTLRWADGTGKMFDVDPETGWGRRALVEIGSWLPIEWLL